MSLIEEALRKQERDGARRPSTRLPPSAPGVPSAPEPADAASQRMPPERQPHRGRRLLMAVGGMLLLIALGLLGLSHLQAHHEVGGQTPASTPAVATRQPAPANAGAATNTAVRVNAAACPLTATGGVVSATTDMAARVPPEPGATQMLASTQGAVSNAVVATATNTMALATNAPAAYVQPPPIMWPSLVFKGSFAANGRTQAVFNGDLTLDVGDTSSNGVRLIAVDERSVQVSYQGEERVYQRGGGMHPAVTNRP